MVVKVGRQAWARIPLRNLDDLLLIFKSLLFTPLVLWGVKQSVDSRVKQKIGIIVYGGTDVPFGFANEKFDFRWHGFTYRCPWSEAKWHGVCYAVRYEMNRMRQVREFIANGGEPGMNLTVEEVKKANGL